MSYKEVMRSLGIPESVRKMKGGHMRKSKDFNGDFVLETKVDLLNFGSMSKDLAEVMQGVKQSKSRKRVNKAEFRKSKSPTKSNRGQLVFSDLNQNLLGYALIFD